jgi:type IV pilus assembly protein PilW
MTSHSPESRHKQTGMSLVELLIGILIGLVATLAIGNLFSSFEARKRMISSGSDAQSSGVLALYYMQRDAQNAGYGLPLYNKEPSPFLCSMNTSINQDGVVINLSPVVIVDGGTGQDIVRIRYGNPASGGAAVRATGNLTAPMLDGRLIGCKAGDVVLFHQTQGAATNCSLARLQAINADRTINTLTEINTAPTDHPVVNLNGTDWVRFSCLGVWNQYEYSVNARRELTRTGGVNGVNPFPNSTAVPVVSDIASLQAQYGVTDTLDPDPSFASPTASGFLNRIDRWTDATGTFGPSMTVIDRNRIRAIRIAVVAKDGGLQKERVSQACNGNLPGISKVCIWKNDLTPASVNLSHIRDWERYRYRTFEVNVPLRNILWNRDAL